MTFFSRSEARILPRMEVIPPRTPFQAALAGRQQFFLARLEFRLKAVSGANRVNAELQTIRRRLWNAKVRIAGPEGVVLDDEADALYDFGLAPWLGRSGEQRGFCIGTRKVRT